jgi:26S proteasome regulatory subunit N5
MSEELIKAEKDYSQTIKEEVPVIENLAKTNLQEAIEKLLVLEKKTRQASDVKSSEIVVQTVVRLFREAGDWKSMNEQVQLLAKKHGQLKQSVTALIQEAIKAIEFAPSVDTKVEIIEGIRDVTEGKIFVEVERARVTRTLADIKLSQGDLDKAATILGELQVETYGSMDMREKTEFILKQVELYLRKGDFIQGQIVSRKIVPRYFDDDSVQDLKLEFYKHKIDIALHESKYLDICQHYRSVYDTPQVKEDESKWKPTLENIVYFIILSPYDNLQSDLIHKIELDSRLESLPQHQQLIKCFTQIELMRWPKIEELYGPLLQSSTAFDVRTPEGKERWNDLRKRVIEHNIRVVSKYYTRITTSRLTALLDLSERETEEFLSRLVTQGTVYARINRPEHIVTFAKPKDNNDVLNEWSNNIATLLSHVETIGHLITKDEMISGLKPRA